MRSLKLRLLAWLLLPLVLVGAAAAGGAYVFLERRLNAAYDLGLGDIARAVVPYIVVTDNGVRLDLPPIGEAILKADSSDQIYYAVRDRGGRLVAGDHLLVPASGTRSDGPVFRDEQREGIPIRLATLAALIDGEPVFVMAAETTNKRERASRDALVSAITPAVLLSIAGIVAVIFGVRRGLGPLDGLREELQSRGHDDLGPVGERHMVEELRPLVDELNLMLARLYEAQQTQARFIANAAHQLRTPIAGLIAQLDLAGRPGADGTIHLARAREGAARLARLAQQILSLAAADPISNPSKRDELCDLADVVKDRADAWLRTATARDAELEFDLAPARFRGDGLLTGELVANLVDNASRYGGRNVRIATRTEERHAVLEVTDDGPGIPPSERPHVFERFYRIDRESTGGSGLGLAIVNEIAQRHGATIDVAEGPTGAGTRFRVSFPVT